jgi:predicted transcriptional regulator
MKTPCEIIVGKILPNIRALVAIELKESYNLKGKNIAKLTGTTEAAVSQYLHGVRGAHINCVNSFPEVQQYVKNAAKDLFERREENPELTESLGQICLALKSNKRFIEICAKDKIALSCGSCIDSSSD